MALVGGFGGMRHNEDTLTFVPRLPEKLSRLAFHIYIWGRCLRVEITEGDATYVMLAGEPMSICHHGDVIMLVTGSPTRCPIPDTPAQPSPKRPPNCWPGQGSPRRE
jgi:alpha,alpha-trehalose phosphorylase